MMDFREAKDTVGRLLELPSPFEQNDWWEDDVAYLDDCDFDRNDVAGLVAVLEAWAIDSDDSDEVFDDDDEGSAVITAWRLIAKLKAVDALPAMLRCLDAATGDEESYDTWENDDLSYALLLLGPDVAEQLIAFALDADRHCAARLAVLRILKDLSESDRSIALTLRPRIVTGLENAAENPVFFNTDLMALAIDWKLVEAAEAIERAFALNKIDCGYTGDWEDVRKELCVKGLGLPMPPKPFNSLDDFRRKIGIGCFSEQALLNMGEFDDDAVEKYLERACREFAVSREGMEILGEHGQASNVHMFLDIAINLCAVTVDTMTVEDVREILLQIFPRKVSMEAEFCEEVVAEIGAFWRFVDRVYDVEHANEIANSVIGMASRFRDAMSDSSNFGMAKSMFMMGDQAGFDMMSQEGRNEFMVAYNESLHFDHRADQAPPPPMSVEQKRLDRKQRKKLLAAKTRSKKKR